MSSSLKILAVGLALGITGCAQGGAGGSRAYGPGGVSMLPLTARAGSPVGPARSRSAVYPAIYVFQGQPDAAYPMIGLVNIGKTLYGATNAGGTDNLGAVYSVTTGGTEGVLHSFTGTPDGENPYAGLTNVNGTVYGTTYQGGVKAGDHGTVFSITPSGSYSIVYSFGSTANDCLLPDSTMVYVASEKALYGTGYAGAAKEVGCIFKLSLAGKKPTESILYSFLGSTKSPTYTSGVVFYKGALYGTTPEGGTNGAGTIYKVTLSGKESIIYSFKGKPDGANPQASLVVMGNKLYGATKQGGLDNCAYAGCGTVFQVTPKGKEKVLYRFTDVASQQDGQAPQSALIAVGKTLYGTTPVSTKGSGLVYSVSRTGKERVVYAFQVPTSDPIGYPENPFAPVISLNGTLYGTTDGNNGQTGAGTVFAVPQ